MSISLTARWKHSTPTIAGANIEISTLSHGDVGFVLPQLRGNRSMHHDASGGRMEGRGVYNAIDDHHACSYPLRIKNQCSPGNVSDQSLPRDPHDRTQRQRMVGKGKCRLGDLQEGQEEDAFVPIEMRALPRDTVNSHVAAGGPRSG